MFQCETRSHIGGNSWSQEIYNHIIIFNADACSGQNPSISFTEEACLNQINWTCDNEWHYLITNLINVISQSTNWTVQKRNWHQKQHPLADKKCDVSLSDHVRVNKKKKPTNLKVLLKKGRSFFQMSGGRKNRKQTIIFRNTNDLHQTFFDHRAFGDLGAKCWKMHWCFLL